MNALFAETSKGSFIKLMVFRLGLCRNGMGAVREMRFVARAELWFSFRTVELPLDLDRSETCPYTDR